MAKAGPMPITVGSTPTDLSVHSGQERELCGVFVIQASVGTPLTLGM